MKIKIDGALFTDAIKVVSTLVNEVELRVNSERLELTEMDDANVAMVILRIPSSACVEWQVDKDENIGINLKDLVPMLRRAGKDDIIDLETTKDIAKLNIKIGSNRTFQVSLIDLERGDKPKTEPELKPEVSLNMPTKEVANALEDVSVVAEAVELKATAGHLFMNGVSELSKVNVDIPIGNLSVEKECAGKYSIEYLAKMIKPSIAENVKLEFGKEYPLRVTYNTEKYYIRWILAPRVENN